MISGYLIFGLIFEALERGSFNIREFYVRRINRIFPALIVVLLGTALLAWMLLYTQEIQAIGLHLIGGATFTSNFILRSQNGYFESKYQPLLHLWSLAVEEQFYLFFPVTAVIAWKSKWDMRWTLIALIELSFAISIRQLRHGEATFAFYSPVTRIWEILAGSLLYHVIARPIVVPRQIASIAAVAKRAAPVIGLFLLALTVFTVDANTAWPGIRALAPVLGTVLIIAGGKDSLINRVVLGHPWLVAIGLISYPLYLWHWPLLVFASMVAEGPLPAAVTWSLVAAAFLLATATYFLLEKKIRFGKHKSRSAVVLLPSLAVCGLCGFAFHRGVIPSRLDAAVGRRTAAWGPDWEVPNAAFTADRKGIIFSRLPGDTARAVVLIGDSHAQQYWPRFLQLHAEKRARLPELDMLTFGGCPLLGGVNNFGVAWDQKPWQCDDFYRTAISFAETQRVRTVIFADFWEGYLLKGMSYLVADREREPLTVSAPGTQEAFDNLERDIAKLVSSGKRVYIVLPHPILPPPTNGAGPPGRLAGLGSTKIERQRNIDRRSFVQFSSMISKTLNGIASRTGATTIDPVDSLCTPTTCPRFTPEGMPMYLDWDHFRAGYARHIHFLDGAILAGSPP